jgi:cell division protein FtsN
VASTAGAYPEFRTAPTPNSLAPLASHEVNLYADSSEGSKGSSSSVFLDEVEVTDAPSAKSPHSKAKPQRDSSAVIPAAQAVKSKPHSNDGAAPVQAALANPAQPVTPAAPSTPKPAAAESASASAASQPEESVLPSAGISKSPVSGTAGSDESKTAKIFVEVGSFKDETWAESAVEKLTHLGFPAVILHKNLLWKQSYHVQVGPYTNPKDAADARDSLAAQGFKGHLVN